MRTLLLLFIVLAMSGCGDDEAVTRPAGTVLHEITAFTYGDNAFELADETHDGAAEVTLGPVDGQPVRLGIDMTLGVATVTYESDGSRARRRVPRAITVRLLDETSALTDSSCDPRWNGPYAAGPPATLSVSCRFMLGDVGAGHDGSIQIFGDGQVRAFGPRDEEVVVAPGIEPLPPLPGDPPGTIVQYLVAEPGGGVRVVDESPGGVAVALLPPTHWRTQLRITRTDRAVSLVVRRMEGNRQNPETVEDPVREVEAEGGLTVDALAPLFEGHDAWPTPIAAIIEIPGSTSHADVIAIIDALKARGVERFSVDVQ